MTWAWKTTKRGDGESLATGDTVLLHLVVRRSDRAGADILATTHGGGRPIRATLGQGELLPEVERALLAAVVGDTLQTGVSSAALAPHPQAADWPDELELELYVVERERDHRPSTTRILESLGRPLPRDPEPGVEGSARIIRDATDVRAQLERDIEHRTDVVRRGHSETARSRLELLTSARQTLDRALSDCSAGRVNDPALRALADSLAAARAALDTPDDGLISKGNR